MGVQSLRLSPGMEHGEETNLGAQMLGIGGDGLQGLGRRTEENAIDRRFVLMGDGGNLFRQRQNDVEILRRKKLGATVVEPLGAGQGLALGTMPISATAIRDTLMPALIALLDMTAKRSGPTECAIR